MKAIGSYKLASVNGRDVPAVYREVFTSQGDRIKSFWTGGRIDLSPSGQYDLALSGATAVGERSDPLDEIRVRGHWAETGSDEVVFRSTHGNISRWEASRDRSVLVARAQHNCGTGPRTIFVFVRD